MPATPLPQELFARPSVTDRIIRVLRHRSVMDVMVAALMTMFPYAPVGATGRHPTLSAARGSGGAVELANPVVTGGSANPSSPTAGRQFTMTVQGSGFSKNSAQFSITGPGCAPCVVANGAMSQSSTTLLVGPITPSQSGTYTVKVQNGAGGAISTSGVNVVVSAAAPAPTLASVSPNPVSGSVGLETMTLTLTGTNLVNKPSVALTWSGGGGGGATLDPSRVTFVSSTQLTVSIDVATSPDTWTVRVTNPDGQASSAIGFSVAVPVPVVTGGNTSPAAPLAGQQFIATVNGSNFMTSAAQMLITGPGCAPCTVANGSLTTRSATTLVAPVTITSAGGYSIAVQNGSGGPQSSGTLGVTVVGSAPTIASISPNSLAGTVVGSQLDTLTITGTNFLTNPTVTVARASGTAALDPSAVTFVDGSHLLVAVDVGPGPDTLRFTVTNSDAQASNTLGVPVARAAAPTLATVSPLPARASSTQQVFVLTGANFWATPTVTVSLLGAWDGQLSDVPPSQVTFVNSGEVHVSFATGSVAADTLTFQVRNADQQTSNTLKVAVSSSAPRVTLTPAANSSVVGSPITIAATWCADEPLTSHQVTLDTVMLADTYVATSRSECVFSGSSAWTLPASYGTHSIHAQAVDGLGRATDVYSAAVYVQDPNAPPPSNPRVAVAPVAGSTIVGSQLQLVVSWCADDAIVTHQTTLDGVTLADTFVPEARAGCLSAGTSTWSLPVSYGAHAVTAQAIDAGSRTTSVASTPITFQAPLAEPQVGPKSTTLNGLPLVTTKAVQFQVSNLGGVPAVYQLAPICGVSSSCSLSRGSITLGPGAVDSVALTYTTPGSTTTAATLRVSATTTSDDGRAATDTGTVVATTGTFSALYAVSATANNQNVVLSPGSIGCCYSWTVKNLGTQTNTYWIGFGITGGLVVRSQDRTYVTLTPGQSTTVSVQVLAPNDPSYFGNLNINADPVKPDSQPLPIGFQVAGQAAMNFMASTSIYKVAVAPKNQLNHLVVPITGAFNGLEYDISNTGPNTATFNYQIACTGISINCRAHGSVPINGAVTLAYQQQLAVLLDMDFPQTQQQVGATGAAKMTVVGTGGAASVSDTGSYAFQFTSSSAVYGVAVSPASQTRLPANPSTTDSVMFSIQNSGSAGSDAFGWTSSCSGAASCVGQSGTTTQVGQGASTAVTVRYTMGSSPGATGTITLAAHSVANPSQTSTGVVTVSVAAVTGIAVQTRGLNPQATLARDECLTMSAGEGAAYECGELRLVHPLPSTRTMGVVHTPALVYSSEHAHPRALVAADVVVGTSLAPSRIDATLSVNGHNITASWPWTGGWTTGVPHRIAVNVDALANSIPTGLYPYTLQVAAFDNTGQLATAQQVDTLVIVDRHASPYGAGWWLDGQEQLMMAAADSSAWLWIGSDGSTRLYRRRSTFVWTVPDSTADRPDTLEHVGATMRRHLGGGAFVEFDSFLHHTRTVDNRGFGIQLTPNGITNAVATITLPIPSGTAPLYQLSYGSDAHLASVDAPAQAAQARRTTLLYNADGTLQSVTDPDMFETSFGYGPDQYVQSRTNKLGDVMRFTYDEVHKLRSATADLSRTGSGSFAVTFCAAESRGIASCPLTIPNGHGLYTLVSGPMTGPANLSQFAINRFGAADTVVDALGHQTTIGRDVRFPMLARSVTSPSGQRVESYFNARALPDSTKAFAIFGDTVSARTVFVYDAQWDAATSVTSATGLLTQAQYDPTTGDLLFQQEGTNSARRVQYGYFPATGLVQSSTPPSPLGPTTHSYDHWGNDSTTTDPRGLTSTVIHDAIGRDSIVLTPIDSLASSSARRIQAYQYDAMDRVLVAIDSAPASSGSSGWQSIHLVTSYDNEGQALSVTRRVFPDQAGINDIVTSAEYDAAGRVTRQFDPNLAGSETRWRYASSGQAVMVVRPTGTDSTEFDLLGRPVHRLISGVAGNSSTADEQMFSYDLAGNLVSASNHAAQINRGYFANGLLRADTLSIANADGAIDGSHRYIVSYLYDRDGRRTSLTRPSQLTALGLFAGTTSYDYDPETGALAHVVEPSVGTFSYAYTLAGALNSLTRPDGSVESYTYRTDGLPATRSEVVGSTTYHNDAFSYDGRAKNLGTQSTVLGTSTASANSYAGLGAVLSASGPSSLSNAETFTRDPLGNVLTRSVAAPTWTGDFTHQYAGHSTRLTRFVGTPANQALDSVTATYDLAGNVTLRQEHLRMPADCSPQLICDPPQPDVLAFAALVNSYTGDGRLQSSSLRTSNDGLGSIDTTRVAPYGAMGRGVDEEYRYDALGRRVWRRAHRDPYCLDVNVTTSPICASFIERTVYDGDQVLAEIRQEASDSVAVVESDASADGLYGVVAYLNGGGVDQPLALARTRGVGAPTLLVLHRDWQGSVDFATLPAAGIVDCARPGAISPCEQISWPGLDQSVAFQRPVSDIGYDAWWGTLAQLANANATGTIDMRARQFDPKLGVFLQEDPLGIAGGLNAYGFGGGDAVNMRDPSGMAACVKTVFIVHPVSEDITDYEPMCLVWGLDPVVITAQAPEWGARLPFAPSDLGKMDPSGGSFSSRQIAQLGHACAIIDCKGVSLYVSPWERSFTFGHSVWLSPGDLCSVARISHELFHVFQFNIFGAGEYLRRALNDRMQEWTGPGSPYQNPLADRNSLEPIAQHIEDNLAGAGQLIGCG